MRNKIQLVLSILAVFFLSWSLFSVSDSFGQKVFQEKGIINADEYLIEDTDAEFRGDVRCKDCHKEQYAHWQKTGHATSWKHVEKEVLEDGKDDCIRCHVTGYGIRTGFNSLKTSSHLLNVQCESCHGPGGNHIAAMKQKGEDPNYGCQSCLIKEKCLQCHTRQRDEDFDFNRDYKKMRHTDEKTAD